MTRMPTVASSAIANIKSANQTCVNQDRPVDFRRMIDTAETHPLCLYFLGLVALIWVENY
ncbi:MAG: hypothetical protein Q7S71_01510 [Candidatus Nitrotoga sp.]|nr:hypothetical protein [Candidatus Nitrotoga sp.]